MTAEFYEDEKATAEERDIGSKQAFGRLLPLLKEHTKGLLFCLGLLAGATLLSLYWPILMKNAVDTDIKGGDFDGLLMTALTIAGIQVATILFQYIQRIRLETIGQDVMVSLKRKLFHHHTSGMTLSPR